RKPSRQYKIDANTSDRCDAAGETRPRLTLCSPSHQPWRRERRKALQLPVGLNSRLLTRKRRKDMKNDISKSWALIMGLLLGAVVVFAQGQGATGVKVNPETMQKKAQSPPPSNATETSSVGNNVKMATPTGSVSWAEQLDVDGNGQVDQ